MTQPRWRVPERIETERLVLRRYVIDDAEQLASTPRPRVFGADGQPWE